MSRIALAAAAALLLCSAVPAVSAAETITEYEDSPLFGDIVVLTIAEGEQVDCGDAGLKEIEDGKYVFTLEETPDTEHLCAPPMAAIIW